MIEQAVDLITESIESTGLVRKVYFSDNDEFLDNKNNLFPAAHINVSNATLDDNTIVASFTTIIVDTKNGDKPLAQVLDTTLSVLSRVVIDLKALSPEEGIQLPQDRTFDVQRIEDDGEQSLYGWAATFELSIPNKLHND